VGKVDAPLHVADGVGVGAVEDDERRAARPAAERGLEHLGRETRPAHAEQDHVADALGRHLVGERGEGRRLRAHGLGQAQPAEPVRQFRHR
jgi:hypothetical protein